MDIQISMKSASDDDCTLSSHFQAAHKSSGAAIRVFSGKQRASLSTMQVQPAGRHSKSDTKQETILNFFRDCAEFLKAVAPDKFEDVEKCHDEAKADARQKHLDRVHAIEESVQQQKNDVFRKLKEAIKEQFLEYHPREFFALNASDAECAICQSELHSELLICD